jgi:transcriptional regulator with XRE-family HTH domain
MRLKWKRFGRDIKIRRRAAGLSIRDVAKAVKITPATVSRADRGLPVSAETMLILSSYLLDTDPRVYIK